MIVYTNFFAGYNTAMTAEYVVGLLGVVVSLFGVAAFVWAFRHRQLKTEDQEMYEAIADDEPDFGSPAAPVRTPRTARRLFALVLTGIFGLIGWMIWQTVVIVMHSPTVPTTVSANSASQR